MSPIPRDDNEPIEKKVWRLELLQDEQEKKNMAMHADIACIKETAEEAKELAMQTSASIETMPLKVIEAIRKEKSGKRLEFRDWMGLVIALVVLLEAFSKYL